MRDLDYIDARLMAKAMARWHVAGDLSDEQLQEDSTACRYLNRRIAELTEEYVPYAVAAIKAIGAEAVRADAMELRNKAYRGFEMAAVNCDVLAKHAFNETEAKRWRAAAIEWRSAGACKSQEGRAKHIEAANRHERHALVAQNP